MIKIFVTNTNGKIELTKAELEELLEQSFLEGQNTVKAISNMTRSYNPIVNKNEPSNVTLLANAPTPATDMDDFKANLSYKITPERIDNIFQKLFNSESTSTPKKPTNAFANLKKEVAGV